MIDPLLPRLTINGHEQQLPGLDHLHQFLQVPKHLDHHLILSQLDLRQRRREGKS